MAINLSDKLAGVIPRGTKEEAIAYARKQGAAEEAGTRSDGTRNPTFLVDFFDEAWIICKALGWDYAIFTGQSSNETGQWAKDNPNWYRLGNPAGLAITNSDNKSLVYENGRDAARAQAVHWWLYLNGALEPGDYLYPYRSLDGHYFEAVGTRNPYSGLNEYYEKSVSTLGDLNVPGRWALIFADDGETMLRVYGTRIRDDSNAMWPNIGNQQVAPVNPAGGETPPMERDPFDLIRDYLIEAPVTKTAEGQGFNYGTRDIIGLCQHETQGIMTGPDRQIFFSVGGERGKDAMVDYDIARNGKIYRFQNPYTSNKIPWASGGGNAGPNRNNPDGKAVDNKYGGGYGGVNRVYAAVECEKEDDGHLNDAQIEAVARLTAYTAAMRGYPANDWKYPDSLGGNIPTSVDHDRISLGTNCEQFAEDRKRFEARTTALLIAFYGDVTGGTGTTGGNPPTSGPTVPTAYAKAAPVPALTKYMSADPNTVPAVIDAEGSKWIFVNDTVRVIRQTPRLQRASSTSLRIGDDLNVGEDFTAKFMVQSSEGEWYYVTKMFTRVRTVDTARSKDLAA